MLLFLVKLAVVGVALRAGIVGLHRLMQRLHDPKLSGRR